MKRDDIVHYEYIYNDMVNELVSNKCELNINDISLSRFKKSDNEILLKYVGKYEGLNYNKLIIGCLRQPRKKYLVSPLIHEYCSTDISADSYRWSIGEAIYTIGCPEYIDDYLEICNDMAYGSSRQMIVRHRPKSRVTANNPSNKTPKSKRPKPSLRSFPA